MRDSPPPPPPNRPSLAPVNIQVSREKMATKGGSIDFKYESCSPRVNQVMKMAALSVFLWNSI